MKNHISFSREQLKYFAMFTMLLNHMAHIFEWQGIWGNLFIGIGYFTGPCMCYFLVEGYYHTRSVKRYMGRLFVMGLIAQLPFNKMTTGDWFLLDNFNMLFTLDLCLVVCILYENKRLRQFMKDLILVLIFMISLKFDWFYLAPFFVYVMLRMRDGSMERKKGRLLMFALYMVNMAANAAIDARPLAAAHGGGPILHIGCSLLYAAFYMIGPSLLTYGLKHYDPEKPISKTPWNKWFFYLFYPAHMLLLIMLK